MGDIYAPHRSFGSNGSHHYAGSFRSIISMFDEDENREACLQAVHIFRHNNPSDYRTELVNEARLVIRGNNVTYPNAMIIRGVLVPEDMLQHVSMFNFYLVLLRILS